MKSKNFTSLLILLLIFSGCGKNVEDSHPEIMKPNWTDVKSENLKLKIGDIISIKTENNLLYGIVMDYNEDEMGIWYGICLSKTKIEKLNINNSQFFGRKIPSGLVTTNCIECFDLTYLNEKGINENLTVFGNIKLNRDNISIGANSTAINISEIERNYEFGAKQRLKKPTECDEKVLSINRIDERYMKLSNIISK
ncbi:MAG: hypothetical protein ABNG98_08120 [Flavobacterium sp.]|jgi:hypothetical protein